MGRQTPTLFPDKEVGQSCIKGMGTPTPAITHCLTQDLGAGKEGDR